MPGADDVTVHVRLGAPAARWAEYRLFLKPLDCEASGAVTRSVRVRPRSVDRTAHMLVRIPRAELRGAHRLMVAAEVRCGRWLLDRTPWRVVDLAAREAYPREAGAAPGCEPVRSR